MNEKNLPDDIHLKSLQELTSLANKIIKNLESEKNLESSSNEYQKLLKLNALIEKKFQTNFKEISENTKSKIKDILNKKNEKKIK
tara:strand:+ start:191 stop:445 length:255 start_codon:yes stop_codon:yes gene_type:complete